MKCLIIALIIAIIVVLALIPMLIHDCKMKRPYIDNSFLAF